MTEKNPIVEIAKKACPAVITITISKDLPQIDGFYLFPFEGKEGFVVPKVKKWKKENTKIGGGSGFIVSSDGFIITSNHVVSDLESSYTVVLEPTKKYPAKVVCRDPINDIAILKIKEKNLPYLPMGDSDKIQLGETVIAVGNPLGEFHDTISAGIISGLSRFINAQSGPNHEISRLKGLIQTDAAINPGNSGGPLVDINGLVIGINTAIVSGAQNLGFAIPINYAKKDLEEIKKYGKIKRPYLGIKYITLNKQTAEQNSLNVSYGALIIRERLGEEAVMENSPAQKAGLKEFDIILEINKEKITEDNPLAHILQKTDTKKPIELKVRRKNKELILKAKLEEK